MLETSGTEPKHDHLLNLSQILWFSHPCRECATSLYEYNNCSCLELYLRCWKVRHNFVWYSIVTPPMSSNKKWTDLSYIGYYHWHERDHDHDHQSMFRRCGCVAWIKISFKVTCRARLICTTVLEAWGSGLRTQLKIVNHSSMIDFSVKQSTWTRFQSHHGD